MNKNKTLLDAVEAYGGCVKVARKMGVSKQAVSEWCYRKVPHRRAADLALLLNIPVHEVRPDVFPEGTILPCQENRGDRDG